MNEIASAMTIVIIAIALPLVLYISARVVSMAYFKTKREHTNALLHDISQQQTGDEDGNKR